MCAAMLRIVWNFILQCVKNVVLMQELDVEEMSRSLFFQTVSFCLYSFLLQQE
jgi:hypothetical protein